MKALSMNPDRRYDSAGHLARELQRYLDGDPVSAQPLTAAYWLRKNFSRYRGRWAAGISLFLLLLVIAGGWLEDRRKFFATQIELREKAETGEMAARDAEVRGLVRLARQQTESGARAEALAYLAKAVRLDPDNREARASLTVALKQFPTLHRFSPGLRLQGTARFVAFSNDGRWFAFFDDSQGAGVRIHDTHSLERLAAFEGNYQARDLKMAPAGDFAAALLAPADASDRGLLVLIGPEGIIHRQTISEEVGTIIFSPDGRQIAVIGKRENEAGKRVGCAAIWGVSNPAAPVLAHPFRELGRPGFSPVAFSADGRCLYFQKREQEGRVHRWALDTGEVTGTGMRAAPENERPFF